MKISQNKLYRLCNKYQWFTNGDCKQYDMLFKTNEEDASLQKLATIILICSIDYEEKYILEILKKEAYLYW